MWLFLRVVVFSTLLSVCANKAYLRLDPKDLNLVFGEDLNINCTISKPLRKQYNASNLAFRFYIQLPASSQSKEGEDCDHSVEAMSNEIDLEDVFVYNETNEIPSDCDEDFALIEESNSFYMIEETSGFYETVDPSYIEIINRYKVRLRYPDVRKKFDGALLTCYVDKINAIPQNICISAHIVVGERPHMPFIRNFKVNNWEKFEFQWDTAKRNKAFDTKYKAWYKWSSSEDFTECPAAKKCDQSCVVDFDLWPVRDLSASTVTFKVNVSNSLGVATTPEKVVDLYDIVTPNPVSDVKVTVANNSACIKFKSPKIDVEMKYEAHFVCAGQPYITILPKTSQFASTVEDCVSGLPSYSDCNVSIQAKPYSYGLWSAMSDPKRFTSPQHVPLGAPEVCRSCFELLSADDKTCSVRVFLKPLPLTIARGRVVEYRASLSLRNNARTSVNESIFHANIAGLDFSGLDLKSNYSIAVVAATEVGYNESIVATPITLSLSAVKTLRSCPRNITAFILNGSTVRLSWLCKHPNISGFTVFWCRVSSHNWCKNPLQWSHVLLNVTRFDVTDLPEYDLVNYLFGIAVETADGHSSGVVWTKCLYNISRVSNPPQIDPKLHGTTVQLSFSKDECYGGFPYAYRVTYCPLVEDKKMCHGSAKELVVDSDVCEVDHLATDTMYLFVVSSLSVAGPSLMNSSIELSVPGAGESSRTVLISCLVFFMTAVIVGVVCRIAYYYYHERIEAIRIITPNIFRSQHENHLQLENSSGGSELYPDYVQPNGSLPKNTHIIDENGSALCNGRSSGLNSSSDHLIPKTPNEGSRNAPDDEDDNASVASDNQPDIYARGNLCNKPDVVPSSTPVEPSFPFDDSTSFLPHCIALDLGDGGNDLRDLPAPGLLGDALHSGGAPGNESDMSSCGYAVGRLSDPHGRTLPSSGDDASIQMHESGINEDNENGHLLLRPVVIAVVDEAKNDKNARIGPLQSYPSLLDGSPGGSISGSSADVTSDHLQTYTSAVVQVILPEGSRGDDYSSSVPSSSDYAFANFKNEEYDPQLDTPAANVIYSTDDADSDGDSDKYATVSFLSDKQTAASSDSLSQASNIPLVLFSASAP